MLSTSLQGDVVVADVEATQARNRGEYFVSEDFVRLNVESGVLTDMSKQYQYDGRVYILTTDLEAQSS